MSMRRNGKLPGFFPPIPDLHLARSTKVRVFYGHHIDPLRGQRAGQGPESQTLAGGTSSGEKVDLFDEK